MSDDLDDLLRPDPRFAKFCTELEQNMPRVLDTLLTVVREAMNVAGEDPDNEVLFTLRCRQAAYSVDSAAQRAWDKSVSIAQGLRSGEL